MPLLCMNEIFTYYMSIVIAHKLRDILKYPFPFNESITENTRFNGEFFICYFQGILNKLGYMTHVLLYSLLLVLSLTCM